MGWPYVISSEFLKQGKPSVAVRLAKVTTALLLRCNAL
jgi:hypothetical protein